MLRYNTIPLGDFARTLPRSGRSLLFGVLADYLEENGENPEYCEFLRLGERLNIASPTMNCTDNLLINQYKALQAKFPVPDQMIVNNVILERPIANFYTGMIGQDSAIVLNWDLFDTEPIRFLAINYTNEQSFTRILNNYRMQRMIMIVINIPYVNVSTLRYTLTKVRLHDIMHLYFRVNSANDWQQLKNLLKASDSIPKGCKVTLVERYNNNNRLEFIK